MADPTLLDVTHNHTTAVEALVTQAGYPVYVGEVTGDDATREYPYVVIWPTPGTVEHDDLGYANAQYICRWQITAVGRDVRETGAALDRTRAQLAGIRPTVTGRNCGLISERDGDVAITKDPDAVDPGTGRPVWFAVADFELHTSPA